MDPIELDFPRRAENQEKQEKREEPKLSFLELMKEIGRTDQNDIRNAGTLSELYGKHSEGLTLHTYHVQKSDVDSPGRGGNEELRRILKRDFDNIAGLSRSPEFPLFFGQQPIFRQRADEISSADITRLQQLADPESRQRLYEREFEPMKDKLVLTRGLEGVGLGFVGAIALGYGIRRGIQFTPGTAGTVTKIGLLCAAYSLPMIGGRVGQGLGEREADSYWNDQMRRTNSVLESLQADRKSRVMDSLKSK